MRWAALFILVIAGGGCLTPQKVPLEFASVSLDSVSLIARSFPVPAGDSFGVVDLILPKNGGFELGGTHVGGIAVDATQFGPGGYLAIVVFREEQQGLVWAATSAGPTSGTLPRGAGVTTDQGPTHSVYVLFAHSDGPSNLLITTWRSLRPQIPPDHEMGHWLQAGAANLSFMFRRPNTTPDRQEVRHNFDFSGTRETLLPLTISNMVASSNHSESHQHLTIGIASFMSESGGQLVKTDWKDEEGTRNLRQTSVASGPAGVQAGFIVSGVDHGETSLRAEVTGLTILDQIDLLHATAATDFANFGKVRRSYAPVGPAISDLNVSCFHDTFSACSSAVLSPKMADETMRSAATMKPLTSTMSSTR